MELCWYSPGFEMTEPNLVFTTYEELERACTRFTCGSFVEFTMSKTDYLGEKGWWVIAIYDDGYEYWPIGRIVKAHDFEVSSLGLRRWRPRYKSKREGLWILLRSWVLG